MQVDKIFAIEKECMELLENIIRITNTFPQTVSDKVVNKQAKKVIALLPKSCSECKGSREVRCNKCCGEGHLLAGGHSNECYACEGKGKVPCPTCSSKKLHICGDLWKSCTLLESQAASLEEFAEITHRLKETIFQELAKNKSIQAKQIEQLLREVQKMNNWYCDQRDARLQLQTKIQQLEAEKKGLSVIEDNSWDLRCINEPTGGDDYNIAWIIIEHHLAEPRERQIGYGKTPFEAIDQALKSEARE